MDASLSLETKILDASKRVYQQLGPGHNEHIYHKALVYELNCLGYSLDTEMNILVKYKDSQGDTHVLASERIDIFIHNENVVLELKATAKPIQSHELAQIKKYFNELNKINITCVFGIVINFPQPTSKEIPSEILSQIVRNHN